MLFAHALGVYATSAFLPALRHSGVLPVDVDVRGGSDRILQFAEMTRPTALMTTPSLAQHLIERIPQSLGVQPADLGLRAVYVVGEIGVGSPASSAGSSRPTAAGSTTGSRPRSRPWRSPATPRTTTGCAP